MTDKPVDELLCAVCQGEQTGVIVEKPGAGTFYHLCDHPRCAEVAKAWRNKGRGGTSYVEKQAMELAGKSGGSFLMNELGGKTDLAKMSPLEWSSFITEVIDRYRAELQRLADDGIPF